MTTTAIRIVSVTNLGDEVVRHAVSIEEASGLARIYRVPSNHMVCIEIDGARAHRWDRDHVVNENRWRRVDPDAMETLGPIREVRRTPRQP